MGIFSFIKNMLIVLIFLYCAPSLVESISARYSSIFMPKPHVGVIPLKGACASADFYLDSLHAFFEDPDIKAILIAVESVQIPSGSAATLHNDLVLLKKKYPKPVVVFIENMCTASAYYSICAADYIIASSGALIGGIGAPIPFVLTPAANLETPITDYHATLAPGQRANLYDAAQDIEQQCIATIAHDRKLSLAHSASWANGKLFSGNQALALGLIDAIGSTCTVRTIIEEKALIEGDIEWIKPSPAQATLTHFIKNLYADTRSMFDPDASSACGC